MTSALKLVFATGEYLVTWNLPTEAGDTFAAHGALTVEGDRPPEGIAHGAFPDIEAQIKGGSGAHFPQIVDAPYLVGHLSNGASALLFNARISYWFAGQARITADGALITLGDVSKPDELTFHSFDLQATGLDAIAGIAPIGKTIIPVGKGTTWSAEVNPDKKQSWETAEAEFVLDFKGSFQAGDPFAFGVGFSPVLTVKLAAPVSFGEVFDVWATPIRSVISIATGRSERLTYASLTVADAEGHEHAAQVFGSGISQEPYDSTFHAVQSIASPLSLKNDGVSLLDLVVNWRAMVNVHHPLTETYGAMLHVSEEHPRSRFLLLIQAIEGTHGWETKASWDKRVATHQAKRADVVAAAKPALEAKQATFLEKNLTNFPPAGLVGALTWLGKKLPDIYKKLDATALVVGLKKSPVSATSTSDALRIVRNDLAHGNKGYDARDLRAALKLLDLMVRGHALQLLGCPTTVIDKVGE